MEDSTAITTRPLGAGEFAVSPKKALEQIREVQAVFKEVMVKDEHYGVIPGSSKPCLLKPGAELLANMYQYAPDEVDIVDKTEQWDVPVTSQSFPLFRYMIRVTLHDRNGRKVAQGFGECNSYESKYRYRSGDRVCPVCGKPTILKGKAEYGGGFICFAKKGGCGAKFKDNDEAITKQPVGKQANDAIYDLVNTLIKMAKKRAFIDAVLSATRTSGIFTQDIEDFATLADVDEAAVDVKTGEVKTKAAPEVIPFGIYKGRSVNDLKSDQLRDFVKAMKKEKKDAEYPSLFKYCETLLGDAFGGVFDMPVEEVTEPAPAAPNARQAAIDANAQMMLLVEVRELFERIIPTFNDKRPSLTKEEKELASRLTNEAFGVKTWDAVRALSEEVLKAGIPKLTKLVIMEYNKQQGGE